jgi:hypothetical protein
VTVLNLEDRAVRLRFTMVGAPPGPPPTPFGATDTCRPGDALIAVRLNLVVLPQ